MKMRSIHVNQTQFHQKGFAHARGLVLKQRHKFGAENDLQLQFVSRARVGYINNSLHLGRKDARIFVRGH